MWVKKYMIDHNYTDTYVVFRDSDGIKERILGSPSTWNGSPVNTSNFTKNTYITNTVGNKGIINYIRPYSLPGTFDFSAFMDCNTQSFELPVIAFIGQQQNFPIGSHKTQTLKNLCCTDSPTNNPTINPTMSPTGYPTSTPTKKPTRSPTNDPTHSPTNVPSKRPTSAPSSPPTADPTTNPTYNFNGFQKCVYDNQTMDGVRLEIQKSDVNEMLGIIITGPVDRWFGYGFGKSVIQSMYFLAPLFCREIIITDSNFI